MARKQSDLTSLPVRAVFDFDHRLTMAIPSDTLLLQALRVFADRPEIRAMFVVDRRDRLEGVLTRDNLVAWLREKHGAPVAVQDWSDLVTVLHTAKVSTVIAEVGSVATVRPDDPTGEAIARMIRDGVVCIPVVDAHERVLGDLRLTELLKRLA